MTAEPPPAVADASVADAGLPDGGASADAGPSDAGPTLQQRITAATETATMNPACSLTVLPEGFYWEVGDRDGLRASGTVTGSNTPMATQVISIASASKWVYSTWVLQKVGSVRPSDVPFLNFTSGRTFPRGTKEVTCGPGETVGECAADIIDGGAIGRFAYGAAHFQDHATRVMGIGAMNAQALTTEVSTTLSSPDFRYLQTNLAGGLNASASEYASFLRKLLKNEFVMGAHLGTSKVCASSACAAGAVLSPAPTDEAWSYSLGHWVEDDPMLGDGAFSSAGALGFYPWIDRSKTWYGVVARRAAAPGGNQGVVSLRCGRLIRQAWVTGRTVTSPTPTP
jgi:hypothetical protein